MKCENCKKTIAFPHPTKPKHCDKCGDLSDSGQAAGSVQKLRCCECNEIHEFKDRKTKSKFATGCPYCGMYCFERLEPNENNEGRIAPKGELR